MNQHTTLEMPSFADSSKKNGSRDPDHAHYGVVVVWYVLPVYKIWRLLLQPFRRYDCGRRNWEWVIWPWPRSF